MKILSKAYGEVNIDERQVITFHKGLFGFETLHEYALLDASQQPFYWLQSLDLVEVAFVLIKPSLFRSDYEAAVVPSELAPLGLSSTEDENALVFSIVTFQKGWEDMTANLQGPVIINRESKRGQQFVSFDPRWETRHNIAAEMAAQKVEAC